MTFVFNLLGMLAFRSKSLRLQAESRMVFVGIFFYSSGFLAYALVKNYVYAELPEITVETSGWIHSLLHINLIQTLFFLLFVFVPGLILLANSIPGEGHGLLISSREYRLHISSMLPLWGLVFFLTAPLQWIVPHFLLIGVFEISIGLLIRSILLSVYTVWAVKQLNGLTTVQATGIFILSWLTLPVLFILT
ncbi:MAG: hypothetical protein JXR49_21985 [Acidobacteria bacterium]|nr:hypothetical protein [Acidobacteriota bacterium]